ncbi:unnamed protein product [Rotaria sp. Silwood2]|nr:unnamed protein product [Rotaria sp. Silwood2]CAF4677148.1 unnamed protein product [Rotaria sp. Silwood2]
MALIIGGCTYSKLKKQFSDLNDIESREQPIIWRLDSVEWIRYLNYIHGPNRQWTEVAPLSSFCCRRASYNRLIDRQYGHIVLYENGLIIDELHFISFRQYSLQGVQLLHVDQQGYILGFRIHTYLKAGDNSRNVYFDVFAPSSVTSEQLRTIVQSRNAKISDSSELYTTLEGVQLGISIENLIR